MLTGLYIVVIAVILGLLLINPIDWLAAFSDGLTLLLRPLTLKRTVRHCWSTSLRGVDINFFESVIARGPVLVFFAGVFGLKAHHALLIRIRLPNGCCLVPGARNRLIRDVCVRRVAQLANIVYLRVACALNNGHFLEGYAQNKFNGWQCAHSSDPSVTLGHYGCLWLFW